MWRTVLLTVGHFSHTHTHTQHAGAFDGSLAFQDESLVENEELKIENEAGTAMLYGLSWRKTRRQTMETAFFRSGFLPQILQEVRGLPWISKIDQTSPKGMDGLHETNGNHKHTHGLEWWILSTRPLRSWWTRRHQGGDQLFCVDTAWSKEFEYTYCNQGFRWRKYFNMILRWLNHF